MLLFVYYNPVFNFRPILNGNKRVMEENQLDFPMQIFMLNHFKRKSLKSKFQIGLFKAEKVAPTEKNIYRLSSKTKRDKNSYFTI